MLRAGLTGLPSTGKTTLFRLLTQASGESAPAARRAASQVGVAQVPDPRLDRLTALFDPRRRVPATVEVSELAGRGSADAMLDVSGFRNADALLHVLRMFRDERVPHASGSLGPARDARQMEDELILADLGVAERRVEKIRQDMKKGRSRELDEELRVIEQCRAALEDGRPLRALAVDAPDARRLRGFSFLSAKPLLVVLNLDEADVADPEGAIARAGLADALSGSGIETVPACAKIELEIAELPPGDRAGFLADLGLADSGLDRVVRAAYRLLGYISSSRWGRTSAGPGRSRAGRRRRRRGRDSQRHRAGVHPRGGRPLRRADGPGRLARRVPRHGEVRLEGKDYVVRDGCVCWADVSNFGFATVHALVEAPLAPESGEAPG